jgi:hypothetical protein
MVNYFLVILLCFLKIGEYLKGIEKWQNVKFVGKPPLSDITAVFP